MTARIDYPRTILIQRQRPSGGALRVALAAVGIVAAVFGFVLLVPPRPAPWPVALVLFAVFVGVVGLILAPRLTVVVTSQELYVRVFPLWSRRIPIDQIVEARAEDYRPIRDYGGWGIKWSLRDSSTCYTVAGTRGVRIVTRANKKYLVGSPDADALARAIESARQPT